jgi:tyrosine-protein kinase Etk/Wzc
MSDKTDLRALQLIARRWWLIVVLSVLGATAGLAYGMLAPKWYMATLTVVQSQRTESGAAGFAAKLPFGLDTVSADVQRIQAVLRSNSVADEVIDRFNLRDRYEVEYREQARETLWRHCSTSVDKKAGVVSLSCEDTEPKVSMAIAAYFGDVGNRVLGRVTASSAREERKFLETQVSKARDEVDESSRQLREFQEKYKVIDLPEQSKAVISAMASIQGEMISKQLELSYLSRFSSRTEAGVVQLKQQLDIMQSKLDELETQTRVNTRSAAPAAHGDKQAEFFPEAMNVPGLRFELEQLLRRQKIADTVFFMLTQRFEMAKVDEARDTSTFQILDHPTLPTYKTRPKRMRVLVLSLFAGFALACALILGPPQLRRLMGRR